MWRIAAALALVLAVQLPTAWYLNDREGTLDASEVRCERERDWAFLDLRAGEPGVVRVVIVNPGEHERWVYGVSHAVETYRARWDGRLEPVDARVLFWERGEGYDGITVPPGGEHAFTNVTLPDGPGPFVLRVEMDGLCGVGRFG